MKRRREWHGAAWVFGAALALLFAFAPLRVARADATIDVNSLRGGLSVTPRADWYIDSSAQLRLEEVVAPSFARAFRPTGGEVATGLETGVVWLHVDVTNRSDQRKAWMLSLPYPHLDYVTLYALRGDGTMREYSTGDMLPFRERPVAQPGFIFPLENEAHETLRVYLRVSTTGTLSLPLTAWEVAELMEHQGKTHTALWMFVGALLMMAFYNAAVFALIRQGEYLTQALLITAMSAAIFTFGGLTFQYLLPDHPVFANKTIGLCLTVASSAAFLTVSQVVSRVPEHAVYKRSFQGLAVGALVVSALITIVPKEVGLRVAIVTTMASIAVGVVSTLTFVQRPHPQLRLYVLSWCFPLVGVPITVLGNFGVLPPWPLVSLAAYLGCALQAVFTSLALAARVKVMGDHLTGLNTQLSSHVVRLEHALENAEQANEAAQRATKAKDEFLATMSHELRTPLNAIINVPQGLLEDFVEQRSAACTRCGAAFVLEGDEQVGAGTRCPECDAEAGLVPSTSREFVGDAERAVRFLHRIERAGHHLLHMVDGVLDLSKMEAGRLELLWSEMDLGVSLRDAVDAMTDPAHRKGIEIQFTLPSTSLYRQGDPVRLKQVWLNLLSNAIKFSDEAGIISVRVSWDAAAEADIIRIHDRGIGIAPEHHERIFTGFEQVHQGANRKYGGTGLGLPISRNLVRMHGGELWVESALGSGATFIVRLPRTRPRVVSTSPPEAIEGELPAS